MGVKINLKFVREALDVPRDELIASVNADLDFIGNDLLQTSRSVTPEDTGRLVNSGTLARFRGTSKKTSVKVAYFARNPKDGFEYSTFIHNGNYNLGDKSRRKIPVRSQFQKNARPVGKGFLIDLALDCQDNWYKYIDNNIEKITRKYK